MLKHRRCFHWLSLGFLISSSWLYADTVEEHFKQIKKNPNALYAFLREMPKGGELHYHLTGGAYPEIMLALAAEADFCINSQNFSLIPKAKPHHQGHLKDETPSCAEGIKVKEVLENQALYDQALRAWSLKDFQPGLESSHAHFFATFFKFYPLMAGNYPQFLADVMRRAASQNELYLEVMLMPGSSQPLQKARLAPTKENYSQLRKEFLADKSFQVEFQRRKLELESLLPETRKVLGCDKDETQAVCQLVVKFQYHVLRAQPLDSFFPEALMAFELAQGLKPSLVGVNLVQAEDGLLALTEYQKQMEVFALLHQSYPQVNIALHAGELAPEMVRPEDLNFHIRQAIEIAGAKRIGHGVDIAFEEDSEALLKKMALLGIAVEINLTSNEKILHIQGKEHPLNYYLSRGVPVVLSTDDEGILRTTLTREYLKAVIEQGLDYASLKQVNRNALTYSFLPGKSIWQDAGKAGFVSSCTDLKAATCLAFVKDNEKAALQRRLELALIDFEQSNSPR